MKTIFLVFSVILLTALSCTNGSSLRSEMEAFTGRQVVLPAELVTDSMDIFHAENKLIIWFDSTECGSCRMSRLYEWDNDPVMQYADAMGNRFNVLLLFSPKKEDARSLSFTLEAYDVSFPVLIDDTGEFLKQNPHLPSDTRLHSFLTDRGNKVVLVGNPLGNEQLWALYKDKIRELVNAGE